MKPPEKYDEMLQAVINHRKTLRMCIGYLISDWSKCKSVSVEDLKKRYNIAGQDQAHDIQRWIDYFGK